MTFCEVWKTDHWFFFLVQRGLSRSKRCIFVPPYVRHWKTKCKSCSRALVCDYKKLLVMHYRLTGKEFAVIRTSVAWWILWSKCWLRQAIRGLDNNRDFSVWERHCLLPDAALTAPLQWEALRCRNRISSITTALMTTRLCQTAAREVYPSSQHTEKHQTRNCHIAIKNLFRK